MRIWKAMFFKYKNLLYSPSETTKTASLHLRIATLFYKHCHISLWPQGSAEHLREKRRPFCVKEWIWEVTNFKNVFLTQTWATHLYTILSFFLNFVLFIRSISLFVFNSQFNPTGFWPNLTFEFEDVFQTVTFYVQSEHFIFIWRK